MKKLLSLTCLLLLIASPSLQAAGLADGTKENLDTDSKGHSDASGSSPSNKRRYGPEDPFVPWRRPTSPVGVHGKTAHVGDVPSVTSTPNAFSHAIGQSVKNVTFAKIIPSYLSANSSNSDSSDSETGYAKFISADGLTLPGIFIGGYGTQIALERGGLSRFISKNLTNNFLLNGNDVTALAASLVTTSAASIAKGNEYFSFQNGVQIIGGEIGIYAGRKLVDGSISTLNWCSKKASGNDNDLINKKTHSDYIKVAKDMTGHIFSAVMYTTFSNLGSTDKHSIPEVD